MKRALDIIHLVLHSMKKTINSLEKGLISALLILTFSCSRELDSPPPGGLMSASNTISEYEMLNTSRIWFEENYQSPCYVVSWTNAKVHTSDTAYCAEARITGTFGMKYLSPEKTGLDADMPHLVVKSVENERQARIMYISPDAGNTQDVRLMDYSNVGIFTGKIYYFDPDEKLSHIILFHNGQADTYFAPVASGNASGGELLMDDEITEDEYNDLPDDIKTLYWYDRKSGKYTLNHFDEVKITPQPSGGDDSGKKTNLEERPRPKDDAFPRKDGGGSSGGGGSSTPDEPIPTFKFNTTKEPILNSIMENIAKVLPDKYKAPIKSLIDSKKLGIRVTQTKKYLFETAPLKDGSYQINVDPTVFTNNKISKDFGIPIAMLHEILHVYLFEIGQLTDHHNFMINKGHMKALLQAYFPTQSAKFYEWGAMAGAWDSNAWLTYGGGNQRRANRFFNKYKISR